MKDYFSETTKDSELYQFTKHHIQIGASFNALMINGSKAGFVEYPIQEQEKLFKNIQAGATAPICLFTPLNHNVVLKPKDLFLVASDDPSTSVEDYLTAACPDANFDVATIKEAYETNFFNKKFTYKDMLTDDKFTELYLTRYHEAPKAIRPYNDYLEVEKLMLEKLCGMLHFPLTLRLPTIQSNKVLKSLDKTIVHNSGIVTKDSSTGTTIAKLSTSTSKNLIKPYYFPDLSCYGLSGCRSTTFKGSKDRASSYHPNDGKVLKLLTQDQSLKTHVGLAFSANYNLLHRRGDSFTYEKFEKNERDMTMWTQFSCVRQFLFRKTGRRHLESFQLVEGEEETLTVANNSSKNFKEEVDQLA